MLHEDGKVDTSATALGREEVEGVGLGDGAVLGGAFDWDAGDPTAAPPASVGAGVDAEVDAGVRRRAAMVLQNSSRPSELPCQYPSPSTVACMASARLLWSTPPPGPVV